MGDGSGEILTTEFLYHDPVKNMDYFKAESPHGFSTFGVVSTGDAGNIFQIVQLLLRKLIPPTLPIEYGISRGGGGGVSSTYPPPTTIPTTSIPEGMLPTVTPVEPSEPLHTVPTPDTTPWQSQEISPTPTNKLGAGLTPLPDLLIQEIAIVFVVILVAAMLVLRWQRGGGF